MQAFRFSLLMILSIFLQTAIIAQPYQLVADSAVTINVTGTSTLHGWTVIANEVKDVPAKLTLTGSENKTIDNFSFGVVISSMDGGRGASMNSKISKALQATEHPMITYTQSEPAILTDLQDDGAFKLQSKGTLNMVGQAKEIIIEVMGQKTTDGIILKGSQPLKFSEFEIEPPSAMFGQIVCGDDIAVNFEFRYVLVP